ncbi:MAG: hypothetical protein FJ404_01625 [Verrucomicrobia bacterium]|nr:hypothetical protein [Verrucomicrobiota bacterium]
MLKLLTIPRPGPAEFSGLERQLNRIGLSQGIEDKAFANHSSDPSRTGLVHLHFFLIQAFANLHFVQLLV